MGKPSAQAVPDPTATAAAQGAANKDTAIAQSELNAVNQNGPNGSLTYSQTGSWADGTPILNATTSLTPTGQAIQDSQNQYTLGLSNLANSQVGQIASNTAAPLDLSGMPQAPTGDSMFTQSAGDAVYNQAKSRLDPQWAQNEDEIKTQLYNQGITDPNSDAYKQAMNTFSQQKNDAYTSAQNDATAGAQTAANGLFANESTANQNAIQTALTQRELPINEAAALMGNAGGVQMPTFVNTPSTNIQPTDVLGAYNLASQVGMNNANQSNSYNQALIGALGGAASAGAYGYAKSDRRLKTDILHVGTLGNGLKLYAFRYKDDAKTKRHLGVMSDEVRKVIPDAVTQHADGFDRVNYAMLGLDGLIDSEAA